MPINHQLKSSESPVELATRAETMEASREPLSLLAINGGSSSIRGLRCMRRSNRCGGGWMGRWIVWA